MRADRTILLSAAEVSGDAFGAVLARELLACAPTLRLAGLGGPRMASAGVDLVDDITDTSVLGYLDGLSHASRYLRARHRFLRALGERQTSAVIAVDAPGMNLPLLRLARRRGIRTIYYMCPQTWLWNSQTAIRRLARAADTVVAVLPGEAQLYREAGLRTIFHGHPIVDVVARGDIRRPGHEVGNGSRIQVGVLPGSRRHEIERLLPRMTAAVQLMARAVGPVAVNLGVPPSGGEGMGDRARRLLQQHSGATAEDGVVVRETDGRGALLRSHVTLAASGSVLLEACLLDAPVVMTYRLDAFSYWIADTLLRIPRRLPHYALPNLIAGERIIPELVQADATPERLAAAAASLVIDEGDRRRMLTGFERVKGMLGAPGVTRAIAADLIELTFADGAEPVARVP